MKYDWNPSQEKTVLYAAIFSRLIIWISSILSNVLIPDYDLSSQLIARLEDTKPLDGVVNLLFVQFTHWDAQYMLRIAQYGYEYEQSHAFFPLLPLFIRISSLVFYPLIYYELMSQRSTMILAGALICNVSFVLAALELYRYDISPFIFVMMQIHQDIPQRCSIGPSLIAPILYDSCWNIHVFDISFESPIERFFDSLSYTESLFTLLSFKGFNALANSKRWLAAFYFGIASAARSNAILYCGFFGYEILKLFLQMRTPIVTHYFEFNIVVEITHSIHLGELVWSHFIEMTARKMWGYSIYCTVPHPNSPWCDSKIPHMYDYIQATYWNQGFLNYWELKQLPNFLIASPMILLSFCGIFTYAKSAFKGKFALTGYLSIDLIPYVVYWAVFLIFAVTRTHVQTITRFFSSIPPVYWFSASLYQENKTYAWWILLYFYLYNVIGVLLFCNFYPWT